MRVFIDANIIVSVVNKEYPLYSNTSRVLSLCTQDGHEMISTSVCFAIAFYFAEKKHGTSLAKEKMQALAKHIGIADCGNDEVQLALANKKVLDFEDGLQHYAAVHAGCAALVTENVKDFYFSELKVMDAESFLKKFMR